MDYRIFNVRRLRKHSYACVGVIHGGLLGTPTASQHNILDSEKRGFFIVFLTGFEHGSWNPLDLESDALPIAATTSPLDGDHIKCWRLSAAPITFMSPWLLFQRSKPQPVELN